jgi:hypothetical protein
MMQVVNDKKIDTDSVGVGDERSGGRDCRDHRSVGHLYFFVDVKRNISIRLTEIKRTKSFRVANALKREERKSAKKLKRKNESIRTDLVDRAWMQSGGL